MQLRLHTSWLPAVVWAAALATLCITAGLTGHDPLSTATWEHWDSAHYESIALGGYEIHPCSSSAGESVHGLCGNAAWFPAYPWLIGALHTLGVPVGVAGVAVAWTFALVALLLLWHVFLRGSLRFVGLAALLYAAFTPGLVYEYAVFPISMFVTFTVAFLALLDRGRWLAAGLAGFAAALVYPIGVIVGPPVAIVSALLWSRTSRVRSAALAGGPPLVAFAVVVAVQRLQTGSWSAFFDVQSKYSPGIHDPAGITVNTLLPLVRTAQPFTHYLAGSWQTLLLTAVLVAVFAHAFLRWRSLTRLDALLLVFSALAWLVPLTQANTSIWRSQTALAPVALLVAKLPRPMAVSVVAACVVVDVAAARLFFEGRLI